MGGVEVEVVEVYAAMWWWCGVCGREQFQLRLQPALSVCVPVLV